MNQTIRRAARGWGLACLLAVIGIGSGCVLQKTKSTDSLGGNYKFQEAGQDVNNLISDLKKEEPRPLVQMSWIPLVKMHLQGFSRNADASTGTKGSSWTPDTPFHASGDYPTGYLLTEWRSFGPLFTYTRGREDRYDLTGSPFDIQESQFALFRLWGRQRTLVKMASGWREETRQDLLFGLLPISHSVAFIPELQPNDLVASRVHRTNADGDGDGSPGASAVARQSPGPDHR